MKKSTVLIVSGVFLLLSGGVYYRYHWRDVDARGATLLMRSFEEHAPAKNTDRLIRRSGEDINVRDRAGRTALFYAARHAQDARFVRELLAAGADASLTDENGQTALMTAARYNPSAEITAELTKHGAHPDAPDRNGDTALLLAARYNGAPVIKALLRAQADPDARNAAGQTARDVLAENGNLTEEEKTDYRQAMLVVSILRGNNLM